MAITYRETWELKRRIEGLTIEKQDFTLIDLNAPICTAVHFINCIFDRTRFGDARLYGCDFTNCQFKRVDLTEATIGAHGGVFTSCIFDTCNFRKGYFYRPEFVECRFQQCKLNQIDFKASSFAHCQFIGKLKDVTFHGKYNSDLTVGAKPNRMHNVDFSEAILQEVDFRDCQLDTCTLPDNTKLHHT
ncbi:pentapeptide repeat-containing protein [Paenibacillus hunanensis]|uniref:pentapeptide repeat-containing protein n=1 Tax=Paenibacillus hunanensis TaxID=539262 RepID=UPI002A6ADA77|nr:pentapeptide repeat-containing protein [Paenibacillus hunanensis]WPP42852.1 pentapeptide repeat-containing protein [Paenibacillus hunanensis]